MNEAEVLNYNPFEGDFGAPGDKCLKDKIVTARKGGFCHDCGQEIKPGERIRSAAHIFDGALMGYRWCQLCCEAMALWDTDNGDAITARHALRRANAEQSGSA